MKKLTTSLLSLAFLCSFMTSCNNDPESYNNDVLVAYSFTLDPSFYNTEGYWVDAYNTTEKFFGLYPSALFSHNAQVDVYEGVEYKSFTGFCPSIVDDPMDHTGSDWTKYQFASLPSPQGMGYFIAHWDVRENENTKLEDRSCLISFGGYTVRPVSMTITNTSYAYWVMKNGSAFSRPFTESDFLALDVYGVLKGQPFLATTIYLYRNGEYVETWQNIDLTGIGDVQQIYFTMRSSDTGEWGMNTPAYFAIGSIQALYYGDQL